MSEKIKFDDIHTKKKQEKLSEMMHKVSQEVLEIENKNKALTKCPVCKSLEISSYTEKFGFKIDKCFNCETLFCNPLPSREQLDLYYNSEMKEFENEFFLDSFEKRIPIFNFRLNKILEYKKSGRLLDVGSAIGIFIEAIKRSEAPFLIECCDPSDDAAAKLGEKYKDFKIHNNWFEDLSVDYKFDVITFWDTLEHICEPHKFLSKARELIKQDGYIFFSTPNTKSFEWSIAGKEHVQILPPGHVILYNKNNIEKLLSDCGLKLISIDTPNGSLDVSYIEKFTQNNNVSLDGFTSTILKENKEELINFINKNKLAGNMMCIAKVK